MSAAVRYIQSEETWTDKTYRSYWDTDTISWLINWWLIQPYEPGLNIFSIGFTNQNLPLFFTQTHKQQIYFSKFQLNKSFAARNDGKLSPFRGTSRLPELLAAGRVKYSHIEPSDWPSGEETDVGGPSGVADWPAGWSDDSETGGFYSNGQSEACSAFITATVLNRQYEGGDGVVRARLSRTRVLHLKLTF